MSLTKAFKIGPESFDVNIFRNKRSLVGVNFCMVSLPFADRKRVTLSIAWAAFAIKISSVFPLVASDSLKDTQKKGKFFYVGEIFLVGINL